MDGDRSQKLHVIEGTVPSLYNVPLGCRFAPRCPYADQLCREQMPALVQDGANRKVRCWHYEKIAELEDTAYAGY
jgi:oligopeptide/dipeptide ABC transporter ATP-binding protein